LRFDTERTPLGELLYKLKSRGETSVAQEIADACKRFVAAWSIRIDAIVPVPASTKRKVQPVQVIAEGLGKALEVPVLDCVSVTRPTKQLKNVYDYDERMRLLEGLYSVDRAAVGGRSILMIDDLFRSGATLNAITQLLYDQGAKDVFVLTITQTRSNR
jgi:predicted amidophosphoribosyltransferase